MNDADLLEAASHWHMMADERERFAEYEESRGHLGAVARTNAKLFRRVATALEMQLQTGVRHCQCCWLPADSCREAPKSRTPTATRR